MNVFVIKLYLEMAPEFCIFILFHFSFPSLEFIYLTLPVYIYIYTFSIYNIEFIPPWILSL